MSINYEIKSISEAFLYFSVNVGIKHPDPVVETSSLSSVEPQDVWYKLAIPDITIECGELSALQLEAITYASQRHGCILPSGERAGFLIGLYVVSVIKYWNNSRGCSQ